MTRSNSRFARLGLGIRSFPWSPTPALPTPALPCCLDRVSPSSDPAFLQLRAATALWRSCLGPVLTSHSLSEMRKGPGRSEALAETAVVRPPAKECWRPPGAARAEEQMGPWTSGGCRAW